MSRFNAKKKHRSPNKSSKISLEGHKILKLTQTDQERCIYF